MKSFLIFLLSIISFNVFCQDSTIMKIDYKLEKEYSFVFENPCYLNKTITVDTCNLFYVNIKKEDNVSRPISIVYNSLGQVSKLIFCENNDCVTFYVKESDNTSKKRESFIVESAMVKLINFFKN